MKCSNCGADLREGIVFCASCGARVPVNVYNEEKSGKKKWKKRQKKEKPPIGCGGILVEFILIIILLVGGVVLISKGMKWYKNHKYTEFVEQTIYFDESKDVKLTEEQKSEDWNSDGISNEDARDMNLNITTSDSDGDGLSDVDEINLYKSNPLKYSTSDDIYSDAYKIKLGYSIDMKYETYKALDTPNSMLKLEANDSYDLGAYYKEYNGAIPSGYYLAHQPFRIFSFDGEANLEITNPKNFEVIKYDTISRKSQKIKSRVENDYLVFEVTDDNPILVVYKEDILKNMDEVSLAEVNSKYLNKTIKEYYVLSYPLYTSLIGGPLYIMEVDNLKANNKTDQELIKYLNDKYGSTNTFKHSYINTMTASIFDKVLSNTLGEVSTDFNDEKYLVNSFVVYGRCQGLEELEALIISNNKGNEKVDLLDKKYQNNNCSYCADSGFVLTKNSFAFKNPVTTSYNSLSTGISFVTTSIYNGYSLPHQIYNEYDMSNSYYDGIWRKELYTQPLGKNLSIYSDKVSGNEKKIDASKMDKMDSELINLLEYYSDDFSNKYPKLIFNWKWNNLRQKQSFISSDTIDNLVMKLKNGKIVTTYLYNLEKSHFVNVYKIVEDAYDSDVLYLKVYDSNFHNDMFWDNDDNYVKQDITIVLKRVYVNTGDKTEIKYVYDYNPINHSSYQYSSFNGGLDGIAFIDEVGNVL